MILFSYQTPQGIVSGIQWVPAEATQVLPTGATPAHPVSQHALPVFVTSLLVYEYRTLWHLLIDLLQMEEP